MNEMKRGDSQDDDDDEFDIKQFEKGLEMKLGQQPLSNTGKGIAHDLDDDY